MFYHRFTRISSSKPWFLRIYRLLILARYTFHVGVVVNTLRLSNFFNDSCIVVPALSDITYFYFTINSTFFLVYYERRYITVLQIYQSWFISEGYDAINKKLLLVEVFYCF
jgi:hypothetical protein